MDVCVRVTCVRKYGVTVREGRGKGSMWLNLSPPLSVSAVVLVCVCVCVCVRACVRVHARVSASSSIEPVYSTGTGRVHLDLDRKSVV